MFGQATRGLRFGQGSAESAVAFVMEQRAQARARKERSRQERKLRKEQAAYGRTPAGKPVDMASLDKLAALGYERCLAAEALRQVPCFGAKSPDMAPCKGVYMSRMLCLLGFCRQCQVLMEACVSASLDSIMAAWLQNE